MKAAVYRGAHQIKIENVPDPVARGKKVLVKFKAGSICGTDLHFYRGDWKWMRKGTILGHDACAIREDTGERVVMVPIANCGHCYYCIRGQPTYCTNGKFYGLTRNGFFSEHKAMSPRSLLPIPADVSDEEAAIVEPVALAIRVLNTLSPKLKDWVTIIGQGAIGLLMTQIAKLKGCRVIATDLEEYRLKLAEKYGADEVINAKEQNTTKEVRKLTTRGSDFVIEAAGNTKAVEITPKLVKKTGKVALIGESKGKLNLEDADEAAFFTMYISPIEYPLAIQLISQKTVDVKTLITHKFNLQDFEKALQTANNPINKAVRIVITQ